MADDPDDSVDSEGGITGVDAFYLFFAWVVSAFVISLAVGLIAGAASPPPVSSPSSTRPPQCSTSCSLFLRWECPGNRFMGTCFGFSACDQPIHACGTDPP